MAVGVKPVIKKINGYVIGGFKPSWEAVNSESRSNNEHVIKVNLQLEDEVPKQRGLSSSKKKNSSVTTIFWIVGVIIVLYLLFK